MSLRPLTAELASKDSPVRRFLDDRFTSGLRDVQRRYRQAAPPLVVPSADRHEANPGTVGAAADWLLRFMLYPRPSLTLAATGAATFGRRSGMVEALMEIAEWLGYEPEAVLDVSTTDFAGPIGGNGADPVQLASVCWALALLTEMCRNPMAAIAGPLGRFENRRASASELLGLASPAALGQLAAFREVFASELLPPLSQRPGRWVLGPVFTGSALMNADADLIAAGLLLDLKTESKLSLGVATVFQVIGYALLDFDDAYHVTSVGTFSARYAYLATWDVGALLDELAGHHVDLSSVRQEFRQLLLACQLSASYGGPARSLVSCPRCRPAQSPGAARLLRTTLVVIRTSNHGPSADSQAAGRGSCHTSHEALGQTMSAIMQLHGRRNSR